MMELKIRGKKVESFRELALLIVIFVCAILLVGPFVMALMWLLSTVDYDELIEKWNLGFPASMFLVLLVIVCVGAWWVLCGTLLGIPWTEDCCECRG